MPAEHRDDADTVAGIAVAVPGVRSLHPGMFGEVATYLPGRRVAGVRVTDNAIDVHVVVDPEAKIRDTAAAVRRAVADVYPSHSVDVTVEDIAPETTQAQNTGGQK